ncbi:hypothetical protein D3C74_387530 [compost metagenome]
MTEYIASSAAVGRRPRMSRMRWYSSGLRPSSAKGCASSGVAAARSTVSRCGRCSEVAAAAGVGALLGAVIESLGVACQPARFDERVIGEATGTGLHRCGQFTGGRERWGRASTNACGGRLPGTWAAGCGTLGERR